MRHRVKTTTLNRNTKQRKALFHGLLYDLVQHGSVVTTQAKAKEIKRLADKIIHKSQTDSVATRRRLHRFFGKRDVVNTLIEKIAPAMNDRVSGFVRVVAKGRRRGDNARLVTLSLVNMPEGLGTLKSNKVYKKKSKPTKKTSKIKTKTKKTVTKKSK